MCFGLKREEEKMKNYLFFGGLFSLRYAYVDLYTGHSYVADSLFIRHKVRIKPQEHMVREDTDYKLIFCRIKRKDRQAFEKALSEISGKMSLYGHNDYDQFCRQMMNELGLEEPEEEELGFAEMNDGEGVRL